VALLFWGVIRDLNRGCFGWLRVMIGSGSDEIRPTFPWKPKSSIMEGGEYDEVDEVDNEVDDEVDGGGSLLVLGLGLHGIVGEVDLIGIGSGS
jgi:hypothetical protein